MTLSCFDLEKRGSIAHIRFNRPEQLNSMTLLFYLELRDAVRALDNEGGTRVLIISSTGKHFSAGMDLSVFEQGDVLTTGSPLDREHLRDVVLALQSAFTALEGARFPVIAAVQGGCIGAGVDLASACDMRYATADSFFCIQEINIGIMADLGTLQRLPKLIPEGIARELAYTGDRMPADRAKACGLVNEVFANQAEMMASVEEVAKRIAAHSPLAVSASKEAITFARDHSVEESLRRTADWQSAILDTKQVLECFVAKKEKREPVFPDLKPRSPMLN